MNINSLDSSAWIEIFHDGANAENFLPAISNLSQIVVSVIALYEVWRYTIQYGDRVRALAVTDSMQQGEVVSIDAGIAIEAADLSVQRKIPMADSLIYITAQKRSARLWTQDEDFEGLPNVRYFPKIKAST